MKKWLVALAGILLSFTLVACGSKTVATTSGGKITESQFYSSLKNTSSGKAVLQQMILNRVLEDQFGDKVAKADVTKQFDDYKKQYGSSFNSVLQQSGTTASQLKSQIRSNLLLKQAVKKYTKISQKDLEKQFKTFKPKVTVSHILVTKKATAENIIQQLKDGKSFASLAKKYSTDNANKNKGGKLEPFDNTDTSLDEKFKTAAFKLETGKYTTTPVKTQFGYHIIKMDNNPGKGTLKEHKSELEDQIIDNDMNNSDKLKSVVTKVLKKGNIQIKDSQLQNVLADYLTTSSSKSSKK